MTTKDLQKLIAEQREEERRTSNNNNSPEMLRLLDRVYERPFYRWQGQPIQQRQ
jgi:hypothetical protein